MHRNLLCISISLLFFTQIVCAKILYVNGAAQGGNQDGTSWTNAYPLLQTAIIEAVYGDTIWVAKGTYTPTTGINRNISFIVKNGVKIYGGFTGVENMLDERDWKENETILSGDIGVIGDSSDNSYTVLYCNFADSTTIIDGFIVKGGNANNASGTVSPSSRTKSGGGLYLEGSSTNEDVRLRVLNCRFFKNEAKANGGGVYMRSTNTGSCSPNFENCVFEKNHAWYGGGMYKEGGSLKHDMTIKKCRFESNSADFYGGALGYNSTNGDKELLMVECELFQNTGELAGASIYQDLFSLQSKFRVAKCYFEDNLSIGGSDINLYRLGGQ